MFGMIYDDVVERVRKFQDARAGMRAETPDGPGFVAGKQIFEGRMEILVDHGEVVGGIRIVVAYPIGEVNLKEKQGC
jgi:hypothetical protein